MFKHKYKHLGVVTLALALFFTLGLVLGALALLYLPENIKSEAAIAFKITECTNFGEVFKENLTFELVWMLVLWMLGSSAVTAPFTGAVISLRGFVIGFSMAFMNTGDLDWFGMFVNSILPQCMTSLPLMSAFIIMCVLNNSGNRSGYNSQTGNFLRGALFFVLVVPFCAVETCIMMLLKKFC